MQRRRRVGRRLRLACVAAVAVSLGTRGARGRAVQGLEVSAALGLAYAQLAYVARRSVRLRRAMAQAHVTISVCMCTCSAAQRPP